MCGRDLVDRAGSKYNETLMNNLNGNGNSDYLLKLERLAAGKPPRAVDLFAGCGGLSLGFHRAGYSILGGVELDPKAALTYASNFFRGQSEDIIEKHARPRDITSFHPSEFMREILGADTPNNLVDVIVGGPPCQAFARIGRAKLREILKHPEAYLKDERANLYTSFLEYVEFFRPLAVLVENVPDIMNYGGKNVAYEIAVTLEGMGYNCRYTILNAALYGVPQHRMRFFLMAILKELDIFPVFPDPTHRADVPVGYKNQAMGMRIAEPKEAYLISPTELIEGFFVPAPGPGSSAKQAVSTQQALEDLPAITLHLDGKKRTGTRSFDSPMAYQHTAHLSEYIADMRSWPSFEARGEIWDHVIRYLPRDYETFKRMSPGDEYPRAREIAEMEIFPEKLTEAEKRVGHRIRRNSKEYKRIWKSCVPPYDPEKFPNKWWKLIPGEPSRTLTAHLGKDTYSHIHYDSAQARVISVREAARLQSFPDGFIFTGPMNAAFRQIGNAVPPLLAFALAKQIRQLLAQALNNRVSIQIRESSLNIDSETESHVG
jgi:DNA (cytosine-5)-methyltransferase 1